MLKNRALSQAEGLWMVPETSGPGSGNSSPMTLTFLPGLEDKRGEQEKYGENMKKKQKNVAILVPNFEATSYMP